MTINVASRLAAWALEVGAREEDFDATAQVVTDLALAEEELATLLKKRGKVLEVADAFL
jgi:hypothetical protein